MTLPADKRAEIVHYRLEKAFSTIKEAKDIAELGYWNLVANRLYYSAYYASSALLINHGLETSSHKGIVRMIGYKYVKEGVLTIEHSRLLGRLFSMRQTGDYEDMFDWTESEVRPLIADVEDYISQIRKMLAPTGE